MRTTVPHGLDALAAVCDVPPHEGAPWRFTARQFRRFFAILYMWRHEIRDGLDHRFLDEVEGFEPANGGTNRRAGRASLYAVIGRCVAAIEYDGPDLYPAAPSLHEISAGR